MRREIDWERKFGKAVILHELNLKLPGQYSYMAPLDPRAVGLAYLGGGAKAAPSEIRAPLHYTVTTLLTYVLQSDPKRVSASILRDEFYWMNVHPVNCGIEKRQLPGSWSFPNRDFASVTGNRSFVRPAFY